ncbi:MAG: polyprenyl synthetase family protein [candidate division KSB1 bacterium]|jgi:geranylgeranyl diphosphate synthase type I|nr:polyprenyl synthetase family protein [candidate division KSB1 bacterium]
MAQEHFIRFLEEASAQVNETIFKSDVIEYLQPEHIKQGVLAYLERPSKRLRPAVLQMACGCVGGDVSKSLHAAAGVELFHTWTLVHDDVIDNDDLRRGDQTVHKLMEERAHADLHIGEPLAKNYGRDIAILSGDVQHGWCTVLFIDCVLRGSVEPRVVLAILRYLHTHVLNLLVYGEVLDVQFGLQKRDISGITESEVINMLWLKTGVLYEFASMAGAMIGKNSPNMEDPDIQAMKNFTGNCGIAFQLQDDILGITGDEKRLGKPVGSDIREGKKTTVLLHALQNASSSEFSKITSVIGRKDATQQDIEDVKNLLITLNGIEYTKSLARDYLTRAAPYLDRFPESEYKELLKEWADYMINREF